MHINCIILHHFFYWVTKPSQITQTYKKMHSTYFQIASTIFNLFQTISSHSTYFPSTSKMHTCEGSPAATGPISLHCTGSGWDEGGYTLLPVTKPPQNSLKPDEHALTTISICVMPLNTLQIIKNHSNIFQHAYIWWHPPQATADGPSLPKVSVASVARSGPAACSSSNASQLIPKAPSQVLAAGQTARPIRCPDQGQAPGSTGHDEAHQQ